MRALTTCLAGISTRAPVAGLRPMRFSRCCTTSLATPGSTNSPHRNNSCSVSCYNSAKIPRNRRTTTKREQYGNANPTDRALPRRDAIALVAAGNTHVRSEHPQVWGDPDIDDDLKLFGNFGYALPAGVELYAHANFARKKVTQGFFFRNPNTRLGVFSNDAGRTLLIGDVLAADQATLQDLLKERQLVHDAMDASRVQRVLEEMERAEARRLQPHYIESFFREAFRQLDGSARQREPRRYQVSHVPALIRNRDRLIGISEPVLPRYERIVFEKPLVAPPGQPLAAFVCPGHPLLDAVFDLILERHRDLLKRGAAVMRSAPI